jgi:hypothetical protein
MTDIQISSRLAAAMRSSEENLDYLAALSAEQQDQLVEQLDHARSAQHAHVRGAAVDAINHLPRILRKPLLKMFEAK